VLDQSGGPASAAISDTNADAGRSRIVDAGWRRAIIAGAVAQRDTSGYRLAFPAAGQVEILPVAAIPIQLERSCGAVAQRWKNFRARHDARPQNATSPVVKWRGRIILKVAFRLAALNVFRISFRCRALAQKAARKS
jgi:hypothetical protein